MKTRVLVVDDDYGVAASLTLLLKQQGLESDSADTPGSALKQLETRVFQLVLLDMNYSRSTTGTEGLDLLKQIKTKHPGLPVILITAWATVELAVEGMKAGAWDFVAKPWENRVLLSSIKTALKLGSSQESPPGISREELDQRYDFSNIIGEDPLLLRVLDQAGRISQTDAPVLIEGESGTGKELIAQAIHRNSLGCGGPFVAVNLGALPEGLFESEMFGHEKGAFTDAGSARIGRFEQAHGGSIFLDEIGELSQNQQVKLLRVLQEKRFDPLGASRSREADFRVISATNRKLTQMVEKELFREDLFYRINLIPLRIPPLRERPGDIPLLVEHFLEGTGLKLECSAMDWLMAQPWTGNIRELKNQVQRARLMARGDILKVEDFQLQDGFKTTTPTHNLPPVGSCTLGEMEEAMVRRSLEHHRGNVSLAAKSLGLTRPALYRRLKRYGIEQ